MIALSVKIPNCLNTAYINTLPHFPSSARKQFAMSKPNDEIDLIVNLTAYDL